MRLKEMLAAERRRRETAELEAARLRDLLQTLSEETTLLLPHATQSLAQVVTQLKRTEQRLEDQQDFVRLVIDSSPNLVYVEDEQSRLVLANKRYTQLLDQEATLELVEVLPSVPGGPDDTDALLLEECYRLRDDQLLWFSTTKMSLLQNDGSHYLLTFSSDITDLKRAQRLAEESVRSKQDFLANMSHEIRTPLHGVMGLVELLKKAPLSEEQADYANLIRSSTEGLLVVINDILDFAKIESGNIQLECIPFDIDRTVREAVRILAFKMEEKGLLLRYEGLDDSLPLVKGDPFRLHQVIVNLVSNAIKFTLQGSITITVEVPPAHGLTQPVTFRVADTGIGISPDKLDQVFSSFQQADSSISRLYGGTGLGLAICKNLVQLQDGSITVRSELEQGSCFSFTIPYTLSDAPLVKEPTVVQQPHLLHGLRVLLVEDNAINQLIAVSMLTQWQVKVDMAQNGEDALVKASQNPYDIILMDIQMPQLDGFGATARLRATAGLNRSTPIVALTADAIRINGDASQAAGFTDYLIKPYSEAALYKLLARISQQLPAPPPPAPSPPAPEPAPKRQYDLHLLGRLATDPSFVRQMLEMFVTRVPDQVQALQEALAAANWPAAAHEAHSLKTTFGTLNIQPEANNLKTVEEMAGMGTALDAAHPLVQAVVQGTAQYVELFKEELTRLSAAV